MSNQFKLESKIWLEQSKDDDFQADECFCYGYNVTEELLPNANWFEYIYLLMTGHRASADKIKLLERLAIVLANPGIRDTSVRAAMNAGVGKAPEASVLVAALVGGSGQYNGAKEVALCMSLIKSLNLDTFLADVQQIKKDSEIWPDIDHTPGFYPYAKHTAKFSLQSLTFLADFSHGQHLTWLVENREQLESKVGNGLSFSAIAAAAFCDLGFTPEQAQYLFLILRLPGAAAHAMEQKNLGWQKFPFFAESVEFEGAAEPLGTPDVDHLIEGYIND